MAFGCGVWGVGCWVWGVGCGGPGERYDRAHFVYLFPIPHSPFPNQRFASNLATWATLGSWSKLEWLPETSQARTPLVVRLCQPNRESLV